MTGKETAEERLRKKQLPVYKVWGAQEIVFLKDALAELELAREEERENLSVKFDKGVPKELVQKSFIVNYQNKNKNVIYYTDAEFILRKATTLACSQGFSAGIKHAHEELQPKWDKVRETEAVIKARKDGFVDGQKDVVKKIKEIQPKKFKAVSSNNERAYIIFENDLKSFLGGKEK